MALCFCYGSREMSNSNDNQLEKNLLERVKQANDILAKISSVNIDGVGKLRNKTKQELQFLKKIHASGNYKKDHLSCSNLKHLEAVAEQLIKNLEICVGVMCNKVWTDEYGNSKKICIDLLLNGGSTWVKVIARNAKALTVLSAGGGCYGQRTIVEQAEQFIECAKQHPFFYKQPSIVFYFACGIENILASELENIGAIVEGVKVDDDAKNNSSIPSEVSCRMDGSSNLACIWSKRTFHNTSQEHRICSRFPQIHCFFNLIQAFNEDEESAMVKCRVRELELVQHLPLLQEVDSPRLNLCVTTLIAYVSALTNGGCSARFETDLLNQHAIWERARPVKPLLDQLFKGRKLYCCRTAINNFQDILKTVGGPGEKQRASDFLTNITIVDDSISDKLTVGGRVKYRTLAIFGTSERLQAVTVTANHAFIRSAMNRGVHFPVFLHESRALTEEKQITET